MPSAPFSVRLDQSLLERLRRLGIRERVPVSQLVERYLEEAVRAEELPGIVFRAGPVGRRAGVVGGPDVWEIVRDARAAPPGADAVEHVVATTDLSEEQVRVALAYYTAYPDEVDARLDDERELAERLTQAVAS
jgi:predicted transcriptional regulator